MKALEKAAKDRADADVERAEAPAATAPAGSAKGEMTLEPIAPKQAGTAGAAPREPSLSARKASGTAPSGGASASREATHAATVIRAGSRGPAGGISAYMRERPLLVFGACAVVFVLGYGGYLYMQLASPGAFVKQPRPTPAPPSASVAPAPAPAAAVTGGSVATLQAAIPAAPLLTPLSELADKEKPPSRPVAGPTTGGGSAQSGATAPAAVPVAPAPAPAAPAARDSIKVIPGGKTPPSVNPLLAEAYAALTAGDFEASQRLYNQMLKSEPGNIDALLGLAAISLQQGNTDQAVKHYLAVLERDPRNTYAQAGMIAIVGGADPLAAETRVKQLIAREPSAFLYFTLGNVYVDQNRWPDAQQAYFQAHHLQPDNPDYAYNLAVALEHIGQPKTALDFYRRAVQAAAAKGRADFSPAAAQQRVSELEKVLR